MQIVRMSKLIIVYENRGVGAYKSRKSKKIILLVAPQTGFINIFHGDRGSCQEQLPAGFAALNRSRRPESSIFHYCIGFNRFATQLLLDPVGYDPKVE